jgi:hypothetical protein
VRSSRPDFFNDVFVTLVDDVAAVDGEFACARHDVLLGAAADDGEIEHGRHLVVRAVRQWEGRDSRQTPFHVLLEEEEFVEDGYQLFDRVHTEVIHSGMAAPAHRLQVDPDRARGAHHHDRLHGAELEPDQVFREVALFREISRARIDPELLVGAEIAADGEVGLDAHLAEHLHRPEKTGDRSLHVDASASVQLPVDHLTTEGITRPWLVDGNHVHVGVGRGPGLVEFEIGIRTS